MSEENRIPGFYKTDIEYINSLDYSDEYADYIVNHHIAPYYVKENTF